MVIRSSRSWTSKFVAAAFASVAAGAFLTVPALAASPAAAPPVPCCGGGGGGYPAASVKASTSTDGYTGADVTVSSNGWQQAVSGQRVDIDYYVKWPNGSESEVYQLAACNAATSCGGTSWYQPCYDCTTPVGTYTVYAFGYATLNGSQFQDSNTAVTTFYLY